LRSSASTFPAPSAVFTSSPPRLAAFSSSPTNTSSSIALGGFQSRSSVPRLRASMVESSELLDGVKREMSAEVTRPRAVRQR